MGSDETDEPYTINYLLGIYIALFEAEVGVLANRYNCNSLYHAFKNVSLEDLILEHEEVSELVMHEGVNVYMEVLLSPFKDPDFGEGKNDIIWYEKHCLISIFNYLRCLNLNKSQY